MNFQSEYESLARRYETFADRFKVLMGRLLSLQDITPEILTVRVKGRQSAKKELVKSRRSNVGARLQDLPDLAGLRIVVLFLSEQSRIRDLLREHFEVLEEERGVVGRPQARRQADLLDHFGYSTDHYVVQLKSPRIELAEWSPFKDMHIEVQVRTALQHAWAATSHKLFWKPEQGQPQSSRELNQLSAQIEGIDQRFEELREERLQAESSPSPPGLNGSTLREFLSSSPWVSGLLHRVRKWSDLHVNHDEPDEVWPARLLKLLGMLGIGDTSQCESAIRKNFSKFSNLFEAMNTANDRAGWEAFPAEVVFFCMFMLMDKPQEGTLVSDFGWSEEHERQFMDIVADVDLLDVDAGSGQRSAVRATYRALRGLDENHFKYVSSNEFRPELVRQVLDERLAACVFRGVLSRDARLRVAKRFDDSSETWSREGDAPATEIGAYHFRKGVDEYFESVRKLEPQLRAILGPDAAVFEDAYSQIRAGIEGVDDSEYRRARHEGRKAGLFVIRSWERNNGYILHPHEDATQLTDEAQVGLEIQDVYPHATIGVNLYLRNEESGTKVKIWNVHPEKNAELARDTMVLGYPFKEESLERFPSLEFIVHEGDAYLLNAHLIHALKDPDPDGSPTRRDVTIAWFIGKSAVSPYRVLHWT